jgi:hypothetical protein
MGASVDDLDDPEDQAECMNIKGFGRKSGRGLATAGIAAAAVITPVATLVEGPGVALASADPSSSPADTQSSPCPGANLCTTPGPDPSVPYGTDPFVPYGPGPVELPGSNQAF